MRFKLLAIEFGIVLGIGGAGCAHHREATQPASGTGQNLTGSYIPQDVQKSGPVTNGKNDVRIIDRSEMEGSGGADVNQTLRQLGVH